MEQGSYCLFSGKRKVVSRPMRSVKYKSIKFSCTKCETSFASNAQMKKHIKTAHTNDLEDTPQTIQSIPMVDNVSLLDISTDEIGTLKQITMEEASPMKITNKKSEVEETEIRPSLEDVTCRKCQF